MIRPTASDLFLPVDTSIMGAGEGPLASGGGPCDPMIADCANYPQNRAAIHLHGGLTPWISDGTPHQWITPAGDPSPYKRGVSMQNVPDIPGTPNPTIVPEAFMDTPMVNGAAYPYLTVARKAYRFRILNACNDRFLNLQLYYADPLNSKEVKMVAAVHKPTSPPNWPSDGRAGGAGGRHHRFLQVAKRLQDYSL